MVALTASATELARRELTIIIEYLFEQSDRTYGHRRIHAELDRLGRPAGLGTSAA